MQRGITRCEKCNAPYHPSCIKTKRKCCTSRPGSPNASSLTREDMIGIMADQMKQISKQLIPINLKLNEVSTQINNVSTRVNGIENFIMDASTRMDKIESDVKGIKNDITFK